MGVVQSGLFLNCQLSYFYQKYLYWFKPAGRSVVLFTGHDCNRCLSRLVETTREKVDVVISLIAHYGDTFQMPWPFNCLSKFYLCIVHNGRLIIQTSSQRCWHFTISDWQKIHFATVVLICTTNTHYNYICKALW